MVLGQEGCNLCRDNVRIVTNCVTKSTLNNDSIFSINIFAKPNDSERIISIFNNAYGDYSKISTSDKYFWYGEKVELVLDDSDSRWCLSVFTDRKLQFSKETKDYKNVKKDSDDI